MIRRIAFVCTDPGVPVFGVKGASIHAQSVLRVLVSEGLEVHVLTPRPGPLTHPLARQVVLHPLPPVGGDTPAEREAAACRADQSVSAELATIRPDLVYERYALWGRTATAWAADRAVPSILEVNAPLVEEQLTYRELVDVDGARAVARSALAAATSVVCVSDPVADWVRRIVPESSALVLANGVDTERVRPAEHPTRAGDAPGFTVGFLGSMKRWHGVDVLIDAMRLARERSPGATPARLLVVGEGPLRESLEAMAVAADVDAEFTGAVPPGEVTKALHRMDVACAPYPAAEGHYFSPLKIFEYMAAGLPVVASAIGQIPQILEHGGLGRLVPPGDPAALADAIAGLRPDYVTRARLGADARRAAVARHTWRAVVDQACASVGVALPVDSSHAAVVR